ncbi:MAG: NADP-dependent malic enzyme [Proteobacteria bacterium]|nr:MAG: NADP-dependent malic enzyme [Pseudomonadota bacterium]QKK11089.1 MAG: NADP-dependent malic enzyme [Pseudomonadota bacterium]
MAEDLRESSLHYHRYPKPGKLAIQATKPLANQRDLAMAYSPGVAFACEEIVNDPTSAAEFTSRGNLVGVITNGSAVLGLGPIGALASKPVMEGKAVLFKQFAGIDVFDIEIHQDDPEQLIETIAGLEPTFGAINLEDIKAPECFIVEKALRARMKIPVFHDDQHGTAICTAAGVLNGLRVVEKEIGQVRLVASGAGAAALACLDLLVALGMKPENITVTDIAGVVYQGRSEQMDPYKARYAIVTEARTLDDVIDGADIFLGLSAPRVLQGEQVARMAPRPLIFALANPTPEIMPEEVLAVRDDAIIATGRSDYPNQINNVLCFPFIFRGALDVGATTINEAMKIACVKAIADLALAEVSDVVADAYQGQSLVFGPDYIIPKPFDPRLITAISPAVAAAAMESGVATRPIEDMRAYREQLSRYVVRSGTVMKGVFNVIREAPRRLLFSGGEDERVLRTVQTLLQENALPPLVVGRRSVVEQNIRRLGLRVRPDSDFELLDPGEYGGYGELAAEYHDLMGRRGVLPADAEGILRSSPTALAALLLRRGEADAMIAGPSGGFHEHYKQIVDIIGLREGVRVPAAMQLLILDKGTYFIADAYINYKPSVDELVEITLLAAAEVRRFGMVPKVALVSHSNFGSVDSPSALRLRQARAIIEQRAPELEIEGEMQTDAALSEKVRQRVFPKSKLTGSANLLVMPSLDAASITFNAIKAIGNGVSVGPILLGTAKPVHILNRTVTTRGAVNLGALAAADAAVS